MAFLPASVPERSSGVRGVLQNDFTGNRDHPFIARMSVEISIVAKLESVSETAYGCSDFAKKSAGVDGPIEQQEDARRGMRYIR
jgi:hypothetical protein